MGKLKGSDYRVDVEKDYQSTEMSVDEVKRLLKLRVTSINDVINIVLHYEISGDKLKIPAVSTDFHCFKR